jgi:putative methyltransferase (TIGR04325 family)
LRLSMQAKRFIRDWIPPRGIELAQSILNHVRPADWEYVAEGWSRIGQIRGWNVESVVEFQTSRWHAYADAITGAAPLAVNHEEWQELRSGKLRDHNTLMTYAYVLALSARQKQSVSVLDWGGGLGHYGLLSKAILPDVGFDYFCHDVPLLCAAGRQMSPWIHFLDDPQECFARTYDLVLASSSVWYEQHWRNVVGSLAAIANPYLYVTRMIFVERCPSYVAIQRTGSASYQTEYLCWILNRQEFIEYVSSLGMELVRECLICDAQHIYKAPEQGSYKGFVFRKRELRYGDAMTTNWGCVEL